MIISIVGMKSKYFDVLNSTRTTRQNFYSYIILVVMPVAVRVIYKSVNYQNRIMFRVVFNTRSYHTGRGVNGVILSHIFNYKRDDNTIPGNARNIPKAEKKINDIFLRQH